MKRIITIILILLLILACSIWGIYHIRGIKERMDKDLDVISQSIEASRYDDASEQAKKLLEDWEQESGKFDSYVKHDNVDKVTESLVRLNGHLQSQLIAESFAELSTIRYNLQHLYESELPLLGNIL